MFNRKILAGSLALTVALGACASVQPKANQTSVTTALRKHQKLSLGGSSHRSSSSAASGKMAASAEFTDMAMPFGEIEFVVDGPLTDSGTEGKVYKFVSANKENVVSLAAALGLKGQVVDTGATGTPDVPGTWTVTDSTRVLTVEQTAPNYWYVSDTATDPVAAIGGCAVVSKTVAVTTIPSETTTTVPDATSTDSTLFLPPPVAAPCDYTPPPVVRPENMLSEQEARAAAVALLDKIGVPSADAHVVVTDDQYAMTVTIDRSISGVGVIGLTTYLSFGANGKLVFGNGMLGTPTAFDSYPIVSAADGVKRLVQYNVGSDVRTMNRSEALAPSTTIAIDAPVLVDPAAPVQPSTELTTAPTPTTSVPKRTIHLNGARLVLGVQWLNDGSGILLVPMYEYSDTESGTWSAIAITDEFMDKTVAPPVESIGAPTEPPVTVVDSTTTVTAGTTIKP